jgi:hypothetical protein
MNEQDLLDTITESALELTARLLNLLLDKCVSVAVEVEDVEVVSLEAIKAMIGSMQSGLNKAKNG